MKFRKIGYFLKEAIVSIYRNRAMSLASVGSIAATLFVLSIIVLGVVNITILVKNLGSQVQVTAFVYDNTPYEELKRAADDILSWEGISNVEFESKEEALEKMRSQLDSNSELLEGYTEENNPLPASFIIEVEKPKFVEEVASKLQQEPFVEKVNYSSELVETLEQIILITRTAGTVLVIILFTISFIIISNTIKIAVFAKRREINIMKYIGATDWFVRGPFMIQGFLVGITGAVIAFASVGFCYWLIVMNEESLTTLFHFIAWKDIAWYLAGVYFLLGGGAGILFSVLSIRKHLRV